MACIVKSARAKPTSVAGNPIPRTSMMTETSVEQLLEEFPAEVIYDAVRTATAGDREAMELCSLVEKRGDSRHNCRVIQQQLRSWKFSDSRRVRVIVIATAQWNRASFRQFFFKMTKKCWTPSVVAAAGSMNSPKHFLTLEIQLLQKSFTSSSKSESLTNEIARA